MNIAKAVLAAALVLTSLLGSVAVPAADAEKAPAAVPAANADKAPAAVPAADEGKAPATKPPPVVYDSPGSVYSQKGADDCIKCHEPESDAPGYSTFDIFKSKHGRRGDKHSPFGPGGFQCEACHGANDRHVRQSAKRELTTVGYKPSSWATPALRNEMCLTCHQDRKRNAWHGDAHERSQVGCNDCHRLHTGTDPVLAKQTQADVCFKCHKKERGEFQKTSTHPVRYGLMACSDCHNAHGSGTAEAMLNKPTMNQTCYACHAEKRGPLLWEHPPATEDCALCHTPHGSTRPALLAKSTTQLCQDCHSVAGHPAVPRTGGALPGKSGGGATFVVAGGCTNCHSQVHGSNHPGGAMLLR